MRFRKFVSCVTVVSCTSPILACAYADTGEVTKNTVSDTTSTSSTVEKIKGIGRSIGGMIGRFIGIMIAISDSDTEKKFDAINSKIFGVTRYTWYFGKNKLSGYFIPVVGTIVFGESGYGLGAIIGDCVEKAITWLISMI